MGRLGTACYSHSITCHHLNAAHLPGSAGTVCSYASSVLAFEHTCQTREHQDMASLGQEERPLCPIWPRFGRVIRMMGRQTFTSAYRRHCSFSFVLDNSQTVLSRPPKPVLEFFQTCCYIIHTHTPRLWFAMY